MSDVIVCSHDGTVYEGEVAERHWNLPPDEILGREHIGCTYGGTWMKKDDFDNSSVADIIALEDPMHNPS